MHRCNPPISTRFVLPRLVTKHGNKDKMFSRGEYLGDLYDIGFDRPESHAIRKDGQMYYAFYARHWNGPVELRGLESRDYHVVDYVNHKDFGAVHGPRAHFRMEFDEYILLEAR